MIIKDTEDCKKQPVWFAKTDIAARAAAAYDAHPELFEHPSHKNLVSEVESVVRPHVVSYSKQYTECRPATKKKAPHTRIKFDHVQFQKGKLEHIVEILESLGIDKNDIVYVPNTPSFYIDVK